MTTDQSPFRKGIQEFNQQDFYACHDTLEAIWMEATEQDKRFYQGILQVAVACYHLGNENRNGAVMLLGEGTKRLRDYLPDYEGIDVEQLLDQSLDLLTQLQQTPPNAIAALQEKLNNGQVAYPKIVFLSNG
ncbi:DUF309 domain-containing protein [Spirulina sp. CS-785/01]|uniref:DUF309 domain-containing protein n=1 Tax=Spirulina sp. CS-785/01 TaxID=3021716 RepID=UPI00232BEF11|nr:DUF309 domain-containing protein [Spirulina sp. CS-785/01]MDB9315159.1 DUF309 domain-containing protein [Spirulina sp. CS-785/01]